MENRVYRSRISVLLIVPILAVMMRPLVPLILSGNIFNPAFYILAGCLLFIVLLFLGIRNELTDTHLVFKMWGFSTLKAPLTEILSVERTYNPLSSGAASLKRLYIRFKKGYKYPFALISPVREKEFLERLQKLNPDIYVRVPEKKGWWRIWDWDI